MASTNKTTNYELSQYVGSDKPTYLGDYNADMLKIDTQMKLNADNASTANSLANTANTTANSALSQAQTADTKATTADTKADTAQASASQANVNALNALSQISDFNLTDFTTYDNTDMTAVSGTINSVSHTTVATNSKGSLGKIYGTIILTPSVTDWVITIANTSLRPDEDIIITGNTLVIIGGGIYEGNIRIKTTGEVQIFASGGRNEVVKIILLNSLLFMANFGDLPV